MKFALWHNLRIQKNGVIYIRDTMQLAPEKWLSGHRYVMYKGEKGKPRSIRVDKLVFASFYQTELNPRSRTWTVSHKNGNEADCKYSNLRMEDHHRETVPKEIRMQICREYKKGVAGCGYMALSNKYGLYPSKIKYIIQTTPRELYARD